MSTSSVRPQPGRRDAEGSRRAKSKSATAQLPNEQQVLAELRGLEPGRWPEVLDFIGYLKHQAQPEPESARARDMTARDLLQSDLVGLWADRDDIRDSLSFARQLRWQAEHRWETADGAT